jgi:hypothetical protein
MLGGVVDMQGVSILCLLVGVAELETGRSKRLSSQQKASEQVDRTVAVILCGFAGLRGVGTVGGIVGVVKIGGRRSLEKLNNFWQVAEEVNGELTWSTCTCRDFWQNKDLQVTVETYRRSHSSRAGLLPICLHMSSLIEPWSCAQQ